MPKNTGRLTCTFATPEDAGEEETLPSMAVMVATVLTPGRLEKHRTELVICPKHLKEHTEQKVGVFVVILGKC